MQFPQSQSADGSQPLTRLLIPVGAIALVAAATMLNPQVRALVSGRLAEGGLRWFLLDGPGGGVIAMFPAALMVALGAVLLFRAPVADIMAGRLGFALRDFGYGLPVGLATGAIFAALAVLAGDARLGFAFDPVGLLLMQPVSNFSEEIITRGFLIVIVQRYWGTWPAIVLSSVAFGLLHGMNGLAVFLAIITISWGWAVVRTGSLWTGLVAHQASDLVSGSLLVAP